MSAYSQHSMQPPGGSQSVMPKPNSYKKGLSFVPNSIARYYSDPILDLLRTAPKIPKGQSAVSEHLSSIYETGSTIPLFDLDQLMNATGEERNRLLHSYGIALANVGVVGIKADRLNALQKQVYSEMERYFHLPFEQKILDWRGAHSLEGYSYLGAEVGPKAELPDFKESFFVPKNLKNWPRGASYNFSRTMNEYYAAMNDYARILLTMIVEYVGESQEEQERLFYQSPNLLQLGYFPTIKPNAAPKGIWSHARRSRALLTLLTPGTTPGLQYYSKHGHWQPVAVPQGYLILIPGLLLEQKSAGLFKARWHRVVNPGGKYTRLERMATVFHATWPGGYSLKPFSFCVEKMTRGMKPRKKKAYLRRYPDVEV